jgi:hypothetical protein
MRAYWRCTYGRHAYERYAYEMVYRRCTPIKCSLLIVIDENAIIAYHALYNGRLRGVAQPEVALRPKLQPKLRP